MGNSIKDLNNFKREHREQREQPNITNDNSCSQNNDHDENIENKNELINDPLNQNQVLQLPLLQIEMKRPFFKSYDNIFEYNGKTLKPGLYYHNITYKNGKYTQIDEWISTPLNVQAITSSMTGGDFGRLLEFIDTNGQLHKWAMPMHMLRSSGEELLGELLSHGVTFARKKRNLIIDYIMGEKPEKRITAVTTIGWHNGVFILPNKVIGGGDVVFQSEIAHECDFESMGTLEEWNHYIGRYCIGNIPLIVSVCTALAGPLLEYINRKHGGGIHWVGDSSTGKSTALEVAGTIWGSPEFIRSWSVTANGFEGVAATRNDTCLILDEINEAIPYDVGKITYMIVNGQGKQRAGRTGNARQIRRWRLMAISSGEKTLESVMNEVGKQPNSGQLVRLLNIPSRFEYGIFSNLHEFNDGRTFADYFKTTSQKYYGHVGSAFIQKLIDNKSELISYFHDMTNYFSQNAKTNLEKRAASAFAIIAMAGELAINYGVISWEPSTALHATLEAYNRWTTFQGASQTEDSKILEAISDFISKHGDSRFSALDETNSNLSTSNRAGWYKGSAETRTFMFTSGALKEAGSGYDRTRIVDTLIQHKWIIDKDADRYTKKVRTSQGLANLYCIRTIENEGKK